jgi:hypothetical protein
VLSICALLFGSESASELYAKISGAQKWRFGGGGGRGALGAEAGLLGLEVLVLGVAVRARGSRRARGNLAAQAIAE